MAHDVIAGEKNGLVIASWNLENFGKSKTDAEILLMAKTVKDVDVLAIQEVVISPYGAQTLARLVAALNQTGAAWSYALSEPTTTVQHSSERYAFVWKSHRCRQVGRAFLDQHTEALIDREPYLITLLPQGWAHPIMLASFHAVPKGKDPASEIAQLKQLPGYYPENPLIFCGDFNLDEEAEVFHDLEKGGYKPSLRNQKTTLKDPCKQDECLANAYDHLFYPRKNIDLHSSGIFPFYKEFETMREARHLSDHVPVWMNVSER